MSRWATWRSAGSGKIAGAAVRLVAAVNAAQRRSVPHDIRREVERGSDPLRAGDAVANLADAPHRVPRKQVVRTSPGEVLA